MVKQIILALNTISDVATSQDKRGWKRYQGSEVLEKQLVRSCKGQNQDRRKC